MKVTLFEFIYRYVYPALRRRLAVILYEEFGLKQSEVAATLGITQSAVSRYVDGRRGATVNLDNIPEVNKYLRDIALRIKLRGMDTYTLQVELIKIIFQLLAKRKLCRIHSSIDSSIDLSKCSVCPRLFSQYVK